MRTRALTNGETAGNLRLRLKKLGLSDRAVDAAWPRWWSDEAEASASARVELRFSVARKLGIDPSSLVEDTQPRFVWKDEARFKHLSGEGDLELSAISSFGRAAGSLLIAGTPNVIPIMGSTPQELRKILLNEQQPFVGLRDLLSLCWSVGIPVIHLRVFPWRQKRMAAMTVRIGERSAILLGKDSNYPPHVAFYLAHELGHILLAHLGRDLAIVDLEPSATGEREEDTEEVAADRFALELLTGSPKPVVLPARHHYNASELARIALRSAARLGVEPGTLALCFGYSTNDWATANASMRRIYDAGKPVWREVNKIARTQLALDEMPEDALDYIDALLGTQTK